MKLKVIACRTFFRELALCGFSCPHPLELAWLNPGPAEAVKQQAQSQIDHTAPDFDAILLPFGAGSGAAEGLVSRNVPLVLPRVHDWAHLLLGADERYRQIAETYGSVAFFNCGAAEMGLPARLRADAVAYLGNSAFPSQRQQVLQLAQRHDTDFVELCQDLSILRSLLNGPWPEEHFLTVPAGSRVAATFRGDILTARPL